MKSQEWVSLNLRLLQMFNSEVSWCHTQITGNCLSSYKRSSGLHLGQDNPGDNWAEAGTSAWATIQILSGLWRKRSKILFQIKVNLHSIWKLRSQSQAKSGEAQWECWNASGSPVALLCFQKSSVLCSQALQRCWFQIPAGLGTSPCSQRWTRQRLSGRSRGRGDTSHLTFLFKIPFFFKKNPWFYSKFKFWVFNFCEP